MSGARDAALIALAEGQPVDWCVVAEVGAGPLGVGADDAPIALRGVFVTPTAALLRLRPPADEVRRDGYVDGRDVALHGVELGAALRRLIDGDSALLDVVFSHRNLVSSELHEHLVERVRDGLHRGHVDHYLRRATERRGGEGAARGRHAAALLLQAEHLQRTGVVSTDAHGLARSTGRPELLAGDPDAATLDELATRVRGAAAGGPLPRSHPRPEAFDEFLLYVREMRW